MRLQLLNLEQVTNGPDNLVQWWDVWLADFSDDVGSRAQAWAIEVLGQSLVVIQQASAANRPTLQHTAMVKAQLGNFASQISNIYTPVVPGIPLLPAPGGRKRDLSSLYHDMEDQSGEPPLELDVTAWERSMLEIDLHPLEVSDLDAHSSDHVHYGQGHRHGHGHGHRYHH